MPSWSVLLVAATALHAGFQLTVTALVYPALGRLAPPDFARGHVRHSRAVVPLVALVYGAALLAAAGAVVDDPRSVLVWSSVLATLVAVAVTAGRAAPLHGRLGRRGPEPGLLRSLLRADRARTLAALVAVLAALASALRG